MTSQQMGKSELLTIQAGFVFRLETMTAFLNTAMYFVIAANHVMAADEQAGFHYCIEALRRNARGVIETGELLQEMETANV